MHVGEQRQAAQVLEHLTDRPCVTACCFPPVCVAGVNLSRRRSLRRGRSARAAARSTATWSRRRRSTRRRSSAPAVDHEVGLAGRATRPPRPRWRAVGSPWRLALVAAIGPDPLGDGAHERVVGHPQPDRVLGLAEVQLEPGRRGSTSVSGPGQNRSATAVARPSTGSASVEGLVGRRAQHRDRHVGASALQREHAARPRSRRRPARPARTRCRSAARPPAAAAPPRSRRPEPRRGRQPTLDAPSPLHHRNLCRSAAADLRTTPQACSRVSRAAVAGSDRTTGRGGRVSGGRRGRGRGRRGRAGSRASVKPAGVARARTASPWVSPISTTRVPVGASQLGGAGDDHARWPRGRSGPARARRAAPSRRPRRAAGRPRDVGRVATTTSTRPRSSSGSAAYQSPSTRRTTAARRPRPARLARATASASADASVAHTSTSGQRSAATDSAMAPEPVPRSTSDAARRAARRWRARPRPRSPAAGSAPAGRRAGRGCGTPHRPSTYWSGSPAGPARDHLVDEAHLALGHRLVERRDLLARRYARWPARRSSAAPARARRRRRRAAARGSRPAARRHGTEPSSAVLRARRACSSATERVDRPRRARRPAPCRACRA